MTSIFWLSTRCEQWTNTAWFEQNVHFSNDDGDDVLFDDI